MSEKNIVVVGAGVSGLTTALLLSRNKQYKITIAAKHMPGDTDAEYASPWAGANFMPVSEEGTKAAEFDANTWPVLYDLATNHPEAAIHLQKTEVNNRKKDAGSVTADWFSSLLLPHPWWEKLFPDYKVLQKDELKPGMDSAKSFTSVCINTALYLPYLASQCLKAGVLIKRATFKHISDAAALGVHSPGKTADLVVNCTGLGASTIGGVEDKTVVPARGQTVLVRNVADVMCGYTVSGTDDHKDDACYIMARAAGGGTILGGCYQKGSWESEPDLDLAMRIMKRCVELCPELTDGKGVEHLDIVRHNVGLRPARDAGPRVESQQLDGLWLVHNYGHGGAGYQSSYGCSQHVVDLVKAAFGGQIE